MPRHFNWRTVAKYKMYEKKFKRPIDIAISSVAIIILSPVIFLIGALIKIIDPGPIIFKQSRVGRDGKIFKFFKFRSMPINTGDIPSDKLSNISLTWVGRFIRRSNLDELPQLFNILRGDMSVVGPRPSIISQRELIDARRENDALLCRPGLTGLAQVNSYDGMSVAEKANWDGIYASNITFRGDIRIILKTFSYLLKPPPMY
jgi:O-antigen biosynthesis protein WbqP